MIRFIMLCGLIVVCLLVWRIGSALSSNAVSMAVGLLFGVLACVPSAILSLRNRPPAPSAWLRASPELVEGGYLIRPTPTGWVVIDLRTNQRVSESQLFLEVHR